MVFHWKSFTNKFFECLQRMHNIFPLVYFISFVFSFLHAHINTHMHGLEQFLFLFCSIFKSGYYEELNLLSRTQTHKNRLFDCEFGTIIYVHLRVITQIFLLFVMKFIPKNTAE